MKLKDGLVLREVAGQYVIVPTGKRVREMHGVFYMNISGALLWTYMEDHERTEEDLINYLQEQFPDLKREKAESDVREFIEAIKQRNLFENGQQAGNAFIMLKNDNYDFENSN